MNFSDEKITRVLESLSLQRYMSIKEILKKKKRLILVIFKDFGIYCRLMLLSNKNTFGRRNIFQCKYKIKCTAEFLCSSMVDISADVNRAKLCQCWSLSRANDCLNPLHPKIGMHILHTVLYTFPKVQTRRICLAIKGFFSWRSFSLFSWR